MTSFTFIKLGVLLFIATPYLSLARFTIYCSVALLCLFLNLFLTSSEQYSAVAPDKGETSEKLLHQAGQLISRHLESCSLQVCTTAFQKATDCTASRLWWSFTTYQSRGRSVALPKRPSKILLIFASKICKHHISSLSM